MNASTHITGTPAALRWAVIIAIAAIAFLASYRYAVAASAAPQTAAAATTGSTWTKYLLYGGIALVAVVVLMKVLKRKK